MLSALKCSAQCVANLVVNHRCEREFAAFVGEAQGRPGLMPKKRWTPLLWWGLLDAANTPTDPSSPDPVSYTHLTLPTIYSV